VLRPLPVNSTPAAIVSAIVVAVFLLIALIPQDVERRMQGYAGGYRRTRYLTRLAKGPASFGLTAIMGKAGDPTTDPTLRWDDEDNRPTTPLGKISIDAIAPDATCNAFSFLPGNVVDGIAGPADDPVFQARSPAYIVSLTRRLAPAP